MERCGVVCQGGEACGAHRDLCARLPCVRLGSRGAAGRAQLEPVRQLHTAPAPAKRLQLQLKAHAAACGRVLLCTGSCSPTLSRPSRRVPPWSCPHCALYTPDHHMLICGHGRALTLTLVCAVCCGGSRWTRRTTTSAAGARATTTRPTTRASCATSSTSGAVIQIQSKLCAHTGSWGACASPHVWLCC